MSKKLLILLLSICLCLCFIVPSFAATLCPDCGELGIYQYSTWSEKDGELVWTKVYKCSECGSYFPVY